MPYHCHIYHTVDEMFILHQLICKISHDFAGLVQDFFHQQYSQKMFIPALMGLQACSLSMLVMRAPCVCRERFSKRFGGDSFRIPYL